MREFANLAELATVKGDEIGASPWLCVDQDRINAFAAATDDHQWIHVDPERTQSELNIPPIAHGYLTLSLIPRFLSEVFCVNSVKRALNYGSNKVRYTNMVHAGDSIRGRFFLKKAVLDEKSMRATMNVTIDIMDAERPALIAEIVSLLYE